MDTAATPSNEKKRWGFWATLGFSVVIIAMYAFAQVAAMVFAAVIDMGSRLVIAALDPELLIRAIISSGFYISIGIIASACVGSMAITAFVLLRENISLREYLAINKLSPGIYFRWLVFVAVFVFLWEQLAFMLEQPGSDWMLQVFVSAKYLPLLWFAFVIAAPFVEELFFRGFLFEGLRDSWVGPMGAVIVTSVIWAAIHVQYDFFQIVMIGILGVLLGVAKIKTGSLYVTLAMHSFFNLIATLQVALFMNS